MSYYQTSTQYHDDLDRFEARTRAEQAERMYNELAEVENIYGPNWEQDADDLHYVLEHGNEIIETGELSQWVGVQSVGKEHVFHKCDKDRCFICEGPLLYCEVCGQGEVELTRFCPGPRVGLHHDDEADWHDQVTELRNQFGG